MKKTISPRVTPPTLEFLETYFRTRTAGAEYILEAMPQIFSQEMVRIKEQFGPAELRLIIEVFNGLIPTPKMAGHHLLASVEDGIRLNNLDAKWQVDGQELVAKIKALTPAQRAMLEIWAIGYWQHQPLPDLDKYVKC